MKSWLVLCWAFLALACADRCPDDGTCERGQTCCKNPANEYECCPFHQAECCKDHLHCCPAGTICDVAKSSCVNSTVSIPWVKRVPADKPQISKSFRMIRAYQGEVDDNICPDKSRCPPEFSCLKALTGYGCCPLSQGVSCSDGKHCCPKDHQCSADSRSCIKKELVTTVLCGDGVSECPDGTTCCETPEGKWGCCPMPEAVCCEDKEHCCPEGTTCDLKHSKCISLFTKKVMPMWDKLPARIRADWENQIGEQITAQTADNGRATTANTVSPSEEEVSVSSVTKAAGGNVPCNDTVACEDGTTCCKTKAGDWSCCPLPEAVCCDDFEHCCPKGKICNLPAQTCDDPTISIPWFKKVPAIPNKSAKAGNVPCNDTTSCEDGTTCCKTKTGEWACCPLPEAVCCDDHEHCCPAGTTCDLATLSCQSTLNLAPSKLKMPAFTKPASTTVATTTQSQVTEEEKDSVEEKVRCDEQTSCPRDTTCCFMASAKKWGCCPLPQAVCCNDGNHCCPKDYKCNDQRTSCIKGEVVIPWYTKLPATTGIQAHPSTERCDDLNQCPQHTTCCQLSPGQWGCCPLPNAVCCPEKEHCCPEGFTCNIASKTCQKLLTLEVETVPLTPVCLPEQQPETSPFKFEDIQCDEHTKCQDGQTCCKMSATTWGCCPYPEAVCCSDMLHCCPNGYTCTETGDCTQDTKLHWFNWHVFLGNKKRNLIV